MLIVTGTFTTDKTINCTYNNKFWEIAISGFIEKNYLKEGDLKSNYELFSSYLQDEFHQKALHGFANCKLRIKDKFNNTHLNAEMFYQLNSTYEARFFPTVAYHHDDPDMFYIKNFKEYNFTGGKCSKGEKIFISKKILFIFYLTIILF